MSKKKLIEGEWGPDFGVISVNYEFSELPGRAEPPQ